MAEEYTIKFKIPKESINTFEAITGLTLDDNLKLTVRYNVETNSYAFVELNDDIIVKNPSLTLTDGYVTKDSLDLYG